MPRAAREVFPGFPHHITQRGVRRNPVFFCPEDYGYYLRLLYKRLQATGARLSAYCLMPNHVHLIITPNTVDDLRGTVAEVHRAYTVYINKREDCTGHLWQGRFSSFPMDERHFLMAARYIELNPVRAQLVSQPEVWSRSSASYHLGLQKNALINDHTLEGLVADWPSFLSEVNPHQSWLEFQQASLSELPMGSTKFLEVLSSMGGKRLVPAKRGRPSRKVGA